MTRHELVKHSLARFLLHGIRKTTVQEIIAPLGISTKTVYKYFAGKEELLEACLALHYDGFKEQMDNSVLLKTDAVTHLFTLLNKGIEEDFKGAPVFYHDLNYYYPQLQDKIISNAFKGHQKRTAEVVSQGIADGLIREEMHPKVMQETIDLLYRSLTRSEVFKPYGLSPFKLAANTLNTYLRGCCTDAGIAIIDKLTIPNT